MQTAARNQKIQYFRGLAIIAVVLIHTCPSGLWQVGIKPFINFAVATFLFLSGYLTRTENTDWQSFFKKRIIRVLIPYLIWSILYSIILSSHLTLKGLIIDILTARATGHMYFIFVYIQFVLLTPLLGKLATSKFRWTGWLVTPAALLIFYYYPLIPGQTLHPVFVKAYGLSFLGWFTFYYLGLLLGNNLLQIDHKSKNILLLFIISIAIQVVEGYMLLRYGVSNCGTQLKLSTVLTSTLFILLAYKYIRSERQLFSSKLLLTIGNYSFGIYLSHILFRYLFSLIPHFDVIPYVINSTIILFASLLFVYLGSKVFPDKISRAFGFK